MIRVAFPLPDPRAWTGGYQYFLNLFRALAYHGRSRVRPVVFVAEDFDAASLAPIGSDIAELVRANIHSTSRTARRLASAVLFGRDREAETVYRDHGVRVVFESARFHGRKFSIPTIAWLPDFQHRQLPQMFGWRARWQREFGYRAQISAARTILLSSEAARRECEALYPASVGKIRVVPFAVEIPREAFAPEKIEIREKYRLPQTYFYLPNQFWAHKNHLLVIDAIRILADKQVPVTVVASGSHVDPRNPGLVDELRGKVSQFGLDERFRLLGYVARDDVYALMKSSLALINPSLSEGWSTTVEEARAMGVPLVLSDISVHREQAGQDARYFDPRSAAAAAAALEEIAGRQLPEPDPESFRREHRARLQEFARKIENLVEETAG